MSKQTIWLLAIILVTITAFLTVFQPVTFAPRKDPADASRYLRPVGTKGEWDSATPNQRPTFRLVGNTPVYLYPPMHDLSLGLDLRGGMRVVLEIVNYGQFNYKLSDRFKLTDTDELARRQGALTDAVRTALGPDAGETAEVAVNNDGVIVTTSAQTQLEAAAQLIKINEAMAKVFPEPDAYKKPEESSVFKVANKNIQDQVRQIMEKRINPDGTKEITAYPKGDNQVVLEIPGEKDPEHVKELIGKTAQMRFMLLPQGMNVSQEDNSKTVSVTSSTGTEVPIADVLKSATLVIQGSDLQPKNQFEYDPQSNKPAVGFFVKKEAAGRFAAITGNNIDRYLAIVLDKDIITAPVIRARIGERGIITGNFTVQEATDLATLLNAGALPSKVRIAENRTVSATLGADAVSKSLVAGLIGLLAVLVFMAAYYRLPGIMANIALVIYIFLSLAVIKLVGSTLTLPGIAGIIISIGMAVDANVIIFERLKEELRTQKPLETAIDVAFSRAWTAIIDANVASLITGSVLYAFGTGAIQNFAITLIIGVAVSLFTAVTVTRLFMKLMIRSKAGHNLAWYGV